MVAAISLSGHRFGSLVAVDVVRGGTRLRWKCVCDCGNEALVAADKLRSGHTKSCGCLRIASGKSRITHGMRHSLTYKTWASMFQRCENESNPSYPKYGGRGIRVCDAWKAFSAFISDMGERPSAAHTIERRDVDGDYCKANCYWTDDDVRQAFNQNLKANNTSGKSGVYWRKDRQRWIAKIFHGGKHVILGSFISKDEAIVCRKKAELVFYGMEKKDGYG